MARLLPRCNTSQVVSRRVLQRAKRLVCVVAMGLENVEANTIHVLRPQSCRSGLLPIGVSIAIEDGVGLLGLGVSVRVFIFSVA